MKKEQKDILNKLQNWHDKNEKLYKLKADLEEKILAVDVQMYKLTHDYENLIEELAPFISPQE